MIECIECGFIGNANPLTEAESTYGFCQTCPECDSIELNFDKENQPTITSTHNGFTY